MAVDTRERRFSMLNFGDGCHLHATFEADGTVDLDDRQHLLDCYSGIAFVAAVVTAAAQCITFNQVVQTITFDQVAQSLVFNQEVQSIVFDEECD